MERHLIALVMLASAPLVSGAKPAPLTGTWGAPGAALTLTRDGGQLQQSCARGQLGPVIPNARGRFKASGTIEPYGAGPQRADGPPQTINAIFSGQVSKGNLELTVTPQHGQSEHYSLVEGRRSKIIRCY